MNKDVNNFTPERITEIRKNIDLSDIPEITDLSGGEFKNWKPIKKAISLRIDLDNLEWLKQGGKGYQIRLNEVLRWARLHNCPLV